LATNLLELLISEEPYMQNASKNLKQEFSFITGENSKCRTRLEDTFVIFVYKTKYTFIIWSSSPALQNLHKWVEKLCTHRNLYTDAYSSLIYK
jgi:hypothetical protein